MAERTTLILDTVESAEADLAYGLSRVVRTGLIKNLDPSVPQEVLIRTLATEGMPQPNSILSARFPNFFARRFLITPKNGGLGFLRILYETPRLPSGVPIATWAVEDDTSLSSTSTQLLPGDLTPFTVTWDNASAPGYDETVTLSYFIPRRVLLLSGMFPDEPSDDLRDAVGTVNSDPFRNKRPGQWLFAGLNSRWDNSDNHFRVTARLWAKEPGEDWSSYGIIRGPDGKFVKVDTTVTNPLKPANQAYAFGIRNKSKGLLKAGLYQVRAFGGLFSTIIDRLPGRTPSVFGGG